MFFEDLNILWEFLIDSFTNPVDRLIHLPIRRIIFFRDMLSISFRHYRAISSHRYAVLITSHK